MKKIISLLLVLVCLLTLSACIKSGDAKDVKINQISSELYTQDEISDALNIAINYFEKEFEGCTLKEIEYIGDDENAGYQEFAERNNSQDVMVFVSTFDVDSSGGDGSLNPNSTYENWKWILVRNADGKWEHVDHGY